LIPFFGNQKLDGITNAKDQQLKLHLPDKSPKTVNNVLATLSVLLKTVAEQNRARRRRDATLSFVSIFSLFRSQARKVPLRERPSRARF
jgi:hypothetical protein